MLAAASPATRRRTDGQYVQNFLFTLLPPRWAWSCLPLGQTGPGPTRGDLVWVEGTSYLLLVGVLPSRGRAQGSKARQYARTQVQSHRCSHQFELVLNLFSLILNIFQMVFMEFENICCSSPPALGLVPIPLRGP